MAMSDCESCWETPCACGHEYSIQKYWSMDRLVNLRDILNNEIKKRMDEPRE